MPEARSKSTTSAKREALFLLAALLFGLLLLPLLVFAVGQTVFGAFAGGSLWTFFANIHGMLRAGNVFVWFLVLSPYLIVQTLRTTFRLFKRPVRQP